MIYEYHFDSAIAYSFMSYNKKLTTLLLYAIYAKRFMDCTSVVVPFIVHRCVQSSINIDIYFSQYAKRMRLTIIVRDEFLR